jgi:uncharacterized membrane protein YphA (DoxX/SURF4 family)
MNSSPNLAHASGAIAWLRVISSLAWLDSAFIGQDAKLSAAFLSGAGLTKAVAEKFLHMAISPRIVDLLQSVVLPHAQFFAVLIALADLAIGISLALGIFTRVGSVLAISRAVTNILVGGGAGPDTVGYNSMLITAAIIMFVSRAGRLFGIDAILLARFPTSKLLNLIA